SSCWCGRSSARMDRATTRLAAGPRCRNQVRTCRLKADRPVHERGDDHAEGDGMHSFDQALTEADLSELEGYLGSEALPEGCMDLEVLDGSLAAGVVGPEPIVPSEWLPLALGFLDEGEEDLAFRDEREGERIVELVTRYYNSVAIVLQEVPDAYAPLFYEAA